MTTSFPAVKLCHILWNSCHAMTDLTFGMRQHGLWPMSHQAYRSRLELLKLQLSLHSFIFCRLSCLSSLSLLCLPLALLLMMVLTFVTNTETYNTYFTMDELLDSLAKSSDSAVGPDDIHYQMLKHLPSDALQSLLNTLNDIWLTGNFPPAWRQSHIHRESKKTRHQTLAHNFTKYWPIFKILLLLDSVGNL